MIDNMIPFYLLKCMVGNQC